MIFTFRRIKCGFLAFYKGYVGKGCNVVIALKRAVEKYEQTSKYI